MADYTPGALTKLSIDGTPYAAVSCDFGKKGTILRRKGLRGTREPYADDARMGPYRVIGTIGLEPDPADFATIMALVIGSGGNVADTLTDFPVVVDRGEETYTYDDVKVGRARIHGRQGGIVGVELDLVGKTETTAGTVNTPGDVAPYIFADLTLTLVSNAKEVSSFDLVIDNHIDGDRFLTNLTLPHVVELDRTVLLDTVHPWSGDNQELYDQAIVGATGNLALNDGSTLSYFTFGALQLPSDSPPIRGKIEVPLELAMEATRSAGNVASIQFVQ